MPSTTAPITAVAGTFVIPIIETDFAPFYLITIQNTVQTSMVEYYISKSDFAYPAQFMASVSYKIQLVENSSYTPIIY